MMRMATACLAAVTRALPGVSVQLLNSGGTVLLTAVTGADGRYLFGGCAPGTYRVFRAHHRIIRLPRSRMHRTTAKTTTATAFSRAAGTETTSPLITLATGTEPGSSGSTSFESTIDFGFRSCPVIAIAPATLAQGLVGTAYTQAMSASGSSATPYAWSTVSSSLPPV
jgi:hypothetical protein